MSEPKNSNRALIRAVKEICKNRSIHVESLSHDWIVTLVKGDVTAKIYGYQFDLNPSAAMQIASDKAALAAVLEAHGIPCVKHELFLNPSLSGYLDDEGNWGRAARFFAEHGSNVVCKPNQGTGGNDVYRINTQRELEEAFQRIHGSERGLTLSPHITIDKEYRLIVLGGECLLCYFKQQPIVVGNGKDTFKGLLSTALLKLEISEEVYAEALSTPMEKLDKIIPDGEAVVVLWKHNLGKGSQPVIVKDRDLFNRLHNLAERARTCCGVEFASVDIVESSGEYFVLEINSGVMIENLAKTLPNGYDLAVSIYGKALSRMLRLE